MTPEVSQSSSQRTFSFSVRIDSVDKFKTLVKEINDSSIVFLILKNEVHLIHADSGFYICKTLNLLLMDDLKSPIALRIAKDDFINLLNDGIIRFTLDYYTNKITLSYSDVYDKFLYQYTLPYQEDLLGNYIENLDAFLNYQEYPKISIKYVSTILKIAKTLQVPLKCDGDTLCVDTGNVFIYQKFQSQPFNVNSRLLWLLRSFSDIIYSVKEYFVVGMPDLIIAVNKYKVSGKHDFDFVTSGKSSYIVKFTLDNVIKMAKKLKLSTGRFTLNFRNSEAKFTSGDRAYSTVLNIIQSKTASSAQSFDDLLDLNQEFKVATAPICKLPSNLFKGVFGNIPSNSAFTLFVKKSFIVMTCNELYIVFGKELEND